jgi:hypothetical protein
MFGLIRLVAIIGGIAYFSPVHQQPLAERIEALQGVPSVLAAGSAAAAPGLVMSSAQALHRAGMEQAAGELARGELGRMIGQLLADKPTR